MLGARRSAHVNRGKPSNNAGAPFGSNAKGQVGLGAFDVLLALVVLPVRLRDSRLELRPTRPPSHT